MEINYQGLNEKLIPSLNEKTSLGLADGKMGICIYLFDYSQKESIKQYRILAEKLLDDIISHIPTITEIDIEQGLAGISLGFSYLIQHKHIQGNHQNILLEFDSRIFKALSSERNKYKITSLIQILYYFYTRINDEKLDHDNSVLYKNISIKILNYISENINADFYKEPLFHSLREYKLPFFLFTLSKLLTIDFYHYKITRIIQEITPQIITIFPRLHSSRLYLLWGMITINHHLQNNLWENHILLLREHINIKYILEKELRTKKIFIDDGATGIFLLLNHINNYYNKYKFEIDIDLFESKINNWIVWNELLNDHYFFTIHNKLINGFIGVIMTYNND